MSVIYRWDIGGDMKGGYTVGLSTRIQLWFVVDLSNIIQLLSGSVWDVQANYIIYQTYVVHDDHKHLILLHVKNILECHSGVVCCCCFGIVLLHCLYCYVVMLFCHVRPTVRRRLWTGRLGQLWSSPSGEHGHRNKTLRCTQLSNGDFPMSCLFYVYQRLSWLSSQLSF